jgi:hypothetical protein
MRECLIVDVMVCRVSNCGFVIVHSMIPFLPSTCISLYTHLAIVPVIIRLDSQCYRPERQGIQG